MNSILEYTIRNCRFIRISANPFWSAATLLLTRIYLCEALKALDSLS